jgi:hypothetical protein
MAYKIETDVLRDLAWLITSFIYHTHTKIARPLTDTHTGLVPGRTILTSNHKSS